MSTPEPSARAAKRQRTEEPPDLSAAKRHDKHWCRDGSVVLHVEDTLFRVHQSTLERVSEAFKDLFAVPQPEDEALLDGCPVVRLEGDSGQDWTSLLDAIYNSLYFVTIESQKLDASLPHILSILRLSTKYRIVAYRRRCIHILSAYFPSDHLPRDIDIAAHPSPAQFIGVMKVARETNALTLLPYAYLLAASRLDEDYFHSKVSLPPMQKLDVYHGKFKLLQAQQFDMFPFVHNMETFEDCEKAPKCRVYGAFTPYLKNPSVPSRILVEIPNSGIGLCDPCNKRACKIFIEGKQKTWERLPEIFGLGKDWDELRRIQNYDSASDPYVSADHCPRKYASLTFCR
ncbi:hypothetical protein EV715DRAFT_204970 [Schizophyllum commune]